MGWSPGNGKVEIVGLKTRQTTVPTLTKEMTVDKNGCLPGNLGSLTRKARDRSLVVVSGLLYI